MKIKVRFILLVAIYVAQQHRERFGEDFNLYYIADSNICTSTIQGNPLLRFHCKNGYANAPQF
jgi:hypothetical protein